MRRRSSSPAPARPAAPSRIRRCRSTCCRPKRSATAAQVETNRILSKLVPSFNFPQPAIADGSDALRPATLRGLSPDQTLVLINGKRRHVSALLNINGTVGRGSAAVDMNSIPALAIERIEVLRDGASSQYGSDAIAGVINIRLKRADAAAARRSAMANMTPRSLALPMSPACRPRPASRCSIRPTAAISSPPPMASASAKDGESYSVATNIGLPFFGTTAAISTSPPSTAIAATPTARASTCGPTTSARPRPPGTRAN